MKDRLGSLDKVGVEVEKTTLGRLIGRFVKVTSGMFKDEVQVRTPDGELRWRTVRTVQPVAAMLAPLVLQRVDFAGCLSRVPVLGKVEA